MNVIEVELIQEMSHFLLKGLEPSPVYLPCQEVVLGGVLQIEGDCREFQLISIKADWDKGRIRRYASFRLMGTRSDDLRLDEEPILGDELVSLLQAAIKQYKGKHGTGPQS